MRPLRWSSIAWSISARVFITKGPWPTIDSSIGCPLRNKSVVFQRLDRKRFILAVENGHFCCASDFARPQPDPALEHK